MEYLIIKNIQYYYSVSQILKEGHECGTFSFSLLSGVYTVNFWASFKSNSIERNRTENLCELD